MAASKKKITAKHRAVTLLDVAFSLVAEMPPSCEALYAAQEAIQQLIVENCPILSPYPTTSPKMQKATKRVKK